MCGCWSLAATRTSRWNRSTLTPAPSVGARTFTTTERPRAWVPVAARRAVPFHVEHAYRTFTADTMMLGMVNLLYVMLTGVFQVRLTMVPGVDPSVAGSRPDRVIASV